MGSITFQEAVLRIRNLKTVVLNPKPENLREVSLSIVQEIVAIKHDYEGILHIALVSGKVTEKNNPEQQSKNEKYLIDLTHTLQDVHTQESGMLFFTSSEIFHQELRRRLTDNPNPPEYEDYVEHWIRIMRSVVDQLFSAKNWLDSRGAKAERDFAIKHRLPIKDFSDYGHLLPKTREW